MAAPKPPEPQSVPGSKEAPSTPAWLTLFYKWVASSLSSLFGTDFLVKTATSDLTAERVVTDTATIVWDWATASQAKANVPSNAVTDSILRDSAALSVIGRASNSSGDPADIAAASDGQVLRRSGTSVGFGQITLSSTNAVTGVLGIANGGTNDSSINAYGLFFGNSSGTAYSQDGNFYFIDTTGETFMFGGNRSSVAGSISFSAANMVSPGSGGGGAFFFTSGNGFGTSASGGDLNFFGGESGSSGSAGNGGAVVLFAGFGNGSNPGGDVYIGSGESSAGADGGVYFYTGPLTVVSMIANEVDWGTNVYHVLDEHSSAPSTPVSGKVSFYAKTDGRIYGKDDTGTEFGLSTIGRHTKWTPAKEMVTRITNGAASGSTETGTNRVMVSTFDFDQTTQEFVQFQVVFEKGWNEGTVTARFHWTADSSSGGVVWALEGVAISDDDALDAAFGTAQQVADTLLATGDEHRTAETPAMTIGGTPVEGDLVVFQVKRVPSDGSDTLAADARLIGVELFYNINAPTDD